MKIYDLLFYATYKVMQKSGNFNDTPVLGGVIFVGLCLVLNVYTVYFILRGFDIITAYSFKRVYTFGNISFGVSILVFSILYYKRNNRYKKILSKYENKRLVNSWLIITIYYTIISAILLISMMFANGYWIFG
nr:hypothetical protein [uncultured Bacteroides sp.]